VLLANLTKNTKYTTPLKRYRRRSKMKKSKWALASLMLGIF